MKTEVNPKDTDRAEAFEMWMTSPMPMVTLTKTFDVSKLLKVCRKSIALNLHNQRKILILQKIYEND